MTERPLMAVSCPQFQPDLAWFDVRYRKNRTFSPISDLALLRYRCHSVSMFERLYVEALLADERAADAIWELWNAGLITDELAAVTWLLIAARM